MNALDQGEAGVDDGLDVQSDMACFLTVLVRRHELHSSYVLACMVF